MNNEHIQRWLAEQAMRGSATAAEIEADEIIRFFAGPDGAIGIADEAAWDLVRSECPIVETDGHIWYRTHPGEMELALDAVDEQIASDISSMLRYLSRRQRLVCHPDRASLVRLATGDVVFVTDSTAGVEDDVETKAEAA